MERIRANGGQLRSARRSPRRTVAVVAGCIVVLAAPTAALADDGASTKSDQPAQGSSLVLRAGTGRMPSPPVVLSAGTGLMPSPTTTDDISHEVELRTESGLRHDEEWIRSVDAASTSTSDALGIPLTPSESADIQGRDRLNAVLGKIEGAAGKSALFGGVSIDQASGGAVRIAMTANPKESAAASALLSTLRNFIPQGVDLEVTVQDASLSELDGIYTTMSNDWAAGKLDNFAITSIGEFGPVVTVTTSGKSPSEVQSALQSQYGASFITATYGAGPDFQVSRNQASGPLYGGIAISTDENQNLCTSGFSKAKGGSSGTSYYEITAGHCNPPGYHWHEGDYSVNGDHFGTGTSNNGFYNAGTTSKCDCQSIGPVPASAATKNFVSSNNVVSSQMTGLPSNTNDSAGYGDGRRICVSGAFYGATHGGDLECGYINGRNFSVQAANGTTLINLITTSADNTVDGDSGGTIISGSDFMGIHSGVSGTNEFFSRSVYIASATGATPTF
jgi:hypothetical protein